MHNVAVIAFDGLVPFDLAIAVELFSHIHLPNGASGYSVRVCGETSEIDAGMYGMHVSHGMSELACAHTIIVPGVADLERVISQPLVTALRRSLARGTRIVSICTGTFVLAASGLLDGKRVTTHWRAADELARRYPNIDVDPNVLFVDEGQVFTSAGATAGIDLCLHLIQRDYGAAVAATAAKLAVVPLRREGGQAQFIDRHNALADSSVLGPLLDWLVANLDEAALTTQVMARRAAMSVRTLNRRFREQTGTTPLDWLNRTRIRRVRELLETTALSVEDIASSTGFGSAASLRAHFGRCLGVSPLAYRRSFRLRAMHQLSASNPSIRESNAS